MYIVLFIHLLYKIPSTNPPILRKLETQKKKVKSCPRKDRRILGKGKTFISHVQETAKCKGKALQNTGVYDCVFFSRVFQETAKCKGEALQNTGVYDCVFFSRVFEKRGYI